MRGTSAVGFIPLADYGVLPRVLKDFKASHPKITLALREMLSPEQITALTSKELDVGLVIPPLSAQEFEHLVVQREQFVVALPAGHLLARGRGPLKVGQLASEPCASTSRPFARSTRKDQPIDVSRWICPSRRPRGHPDANGGEPCLKRTRYRASSVVRRQYRPARRRLQTAVGHS